MAPAAAADVKCASVGELLAEVQACSKNDIVVERAQQCHDRVEAEWKKAAPAELKKTMSLAVSRKASRQEAEFAFTHGDYKKTKSKLWNLLELTDQKAGLLSKYSTAMLRDYSIEAASGPLPCYAENFARLKKIVQSMDRMLVEGDETLAMAEKLHEIAFGRDGGLDTSDSNGLVQGVNVGSGTSENGQSDVTGIKEDKAKRSGQKSVLAEQNERAKKEFTQWEIWRAKEAEKLHSYLDTPEMKAAKAERESSVTKGEALEVFSPKGTSRDFGAEISASAEAMARELGLGKQGARAPASQNNETAQREALSVGAFVFKEGASGQSSVKLELKEGSAGPAAVKPLGVLGEGEALASGEAADNSFDPADLSFDGKTISSLGERLRIAKGSLRELLKGKQGAPAARGPEVSLFSAVSDRYRRSELFRRARVTQVPLGSFDPHLER